MIMEALLGAFPTHRFIGEETAVDGTDDVLTDTPTWIIDPLGIPFYHRVVSCVCVRCVRAVRVCAVCAVLLTSHHGQMERSILCTSFPTFACASGSW